MQDTLHAASATADTVARSGQHGFFWTAVILVAFVLAIGGLYKAFHHEDTSPPQTEV